MRGAVGAAVVSAWLAVACEAGEVAPVEASLGELSLVGPRYVRVRGVARYDTAVTLPTPGGWLGEPARWRLFGLVDDPAAAPGELGVVVRTLRPPPSGRDAEVLTLDAAVLPLDARRVPKAARERWTAQGWSIAADAVLLEPVRIRSEGAEWVEP